MRSGIQSPPDKSQLIVRDFALYALLLNTTAKKNWNSRFETTHEIAAHDTRITEHNEAFIIGCENNRFKFCSFCITLIVLYTACCECEPRGR